MLTKIYVPRILCNHSGRGFRGNASQLLPCKSISTASGFPGIPVRNGRKNAGAVLSGVSGKGMRNDTIAKVNFTHFCAAVVFSKVIFSARLKMETGA